MVAPARQQDMEKFGGMAEDLALELPHLQQGTKRGGTGGREEEPKRRKDGDEEELRLGRDIEEVFGVEGVTGKVERLLGGKLGEAVVQDRGQVLRVLFHASQVWVGAASDRPLLAVWPLADLATLLPVGQQVRLNARRREDGELEATALWEHRYPWTPPPGYRCSALVSQLDLQAREQRFKVTGRPQHHTNPLSGAADTAVSAREERGQIPLQYDALVKEAAAATKATEAAEGETAAADTVETVGRTVSREEARLAREQVPAAEEPGGGLAPRRRSRRQASADADVANRATSRSPSFGSMGSARTKRPLSRSPSAPRGRCRISPDPQPGPSTEGWGVVRVSLLVQ